MKSKVISVLAFLGLMAFTAMDALAQCPMCKAAVESREGAANSPLSSGLNTGILYLFVLPYLCIAAVAFVAWRHIRRNRQLAKAGIDGR